MNQTIEKFGYPATLVRELKHWVILLRPTQVTLGSLVLAAKSDATAYSELPPEAFVEQRQAIAEIERSLQKFTQYERINYLMLMMVDPNVHFHVIPRYSQERLWKEIKFADIGWPGPPRLDVGVKLDEKQIDELVSDVSSNFR